MDERLLNVLQKAHKLTGIQLTEDQVIALALKADKPEDKKKPPEGYASWEEFNSQHPRGAGGKFGSGGGAKPQAPKSPSAADFYKNPSSPEARADHEAQLRVGLQKLRSMMRNPDTMRASIEAQQPGTIIYSVSGKNDFGVRLPDRYYKYARQPNGSWKMNEVVKN